MSEQRMTEDDVARLVGGGPLSLFFANLTGYGFVWGLAGVAWALALGRPWLWGFAAGVLVAIGGSGWVVLTSRSPTERLIRTTQSKTPFGQWGTLALFAGALAALVRGLVSFL